MARTQTASIVLAAASATAVCAAQTPTAAAGFTINGGSASGGVATLDAARRILFTTAGAEAGKIAVVTGTDRNRNVQKESVTLVTTSTVATKMDFLTVTSISISSNAAGNISVGTNGVASTRWLVLSAFGDSPVGVAVTLGGATANVSVEGTLDDFDAAQVMARPDAAAATQAANNILLFVPPVPFGLTGLTTLTADTLGSTAIPLRAIRLTVNSGATSVGTKITALQPQPR